jgi:hypothetical protein
MFSYGQDVLNLSYFWIYLLYRTIEFQIEEFDVKIALLHWWSRGEDIMIYMEQLEGFEVVGEERFS